MSKSDGADRLCHRTDYALFRVHMGEYLTSDLKWMQRDLHDVLFATPFVDQLLQYIALAVWE